MGLPLYIRQLGGCYYKVGKLKPEIRQKLNEAYGGRRDGREGV